MVPDSLGTEMRKCPLSLQEIKVKYIGHSAFSVVVLWTGMSHEVEVVNSLYINLNSLEVVKEVINFVTVKILETG